MSIPTYFRWRRNHDIGPGRRPLLLKYRSSKAFIVLTCGIAVFTDIFLYAVIVPVIPFALHERVNIPTSQVQSWVSILIAVYGGALALFSPVCGWAADRSRSRRLPLLIGLFALGASTILLNLGTSIAILILGRVLQGVSAAVVWVVGLALVADTVPKEEVAETLGYIFVGLSLGFLAGPLLGGVVFRQAGFNAVFGMTYALIGVDIGLRLFLIEKKVARKWETDEGSVNPKSKGKGVEVDGDPIRSPSVIARERDDDEKEEDKEYDTQPIEEVREASNYRELEISSIRRQSPPAVRATSPSAPDDSSSIVAAAARPKIRLPPVITLLSSRRLLAALWGTWVLAGIMTQFDSVLPIHVQRTFSWSSTGAGLIFVPVVLPSFISPLFGYLCNKYGPRWPAAIGFLGLVPAEALLRLVTYNSLGQKVLLCALLALIGLFLSMAVTVVMAEITYIIVEKEQERPGMFGDKGAYAQAYGLFNLAWAVGCLIGPIWAGFVSERAGWGTMTWTMALLAGVSALPAWLWTGGWVFGKRRLSEDVEMQDRGAWDTGGSEGRIKGQSH